MKKMVVSLYLCIGVMFSGWACSTYPPGMEYRIINNQVYYTKAYNAEPVIVEGADSKTFIINLWPGTHYGADINHVYYRGQVLEGLDPSQAAFLRDYTIERDDRSYDGYMRDNALVFYRGQLLQSVDSSHFDWLPSYEDSEKKWAPFATDGQHIYYHGEIVAGNPQTAFELTAQYYLDDQHIYFLGRPIDGALPTFFEMKSGRAGSRFIISNGYVFYKGERLPLNATSFEVLDDVHGSRVGCSNWAYAGSILRDHSGIYVMSASGSISRVDRADPATFKIIDNMRWDIGRIVWAMDQHQTYYYSRFGNIDVTVYTLPINLLETNLKTIKLDDRDVATFFGNDHYLFRFNFNLPEMIENMAASVGVDPKTFDVYLALWKAVVFRDEHGFYISPVVSSARNRVLINITQQDAKLVCLEKNHLCLLNGNNLYYVYEDGSIENMQVDGTSLRCIRGDKLLSASLDGYTSAGMCFDETYFYNRGEQRSMYSGGYNAALSYAVDATEVEALRLQSLQRISIESKPFIQEEETFLQ